MAPGKQQRNNKFPKQRKYSQGVHHREKGKSETNQNDSGFCQDSRQENTSGGSTLFLRPGEAIISQQAELIPQTGASVLCSNKLLPCVPGSASKPRRERTWGVVPEQASKCQGAGVPAGADKPISRPPGAASPGGHGPRPARSATLQGPLPFCRCPAAAPAATGLGVSGF